MPLDPERRTNLDNWNDRVPIHVSSADYNLAAYAADPDHLSGVVDYDRTILGDVSGKTLLHLQCHIGTDTVSWARLGATVTGVDFSEPALEAARTLSADSGTPARFVHAELYDAPNVLDEQFDVVYTGVGAINWLPDIEAWARVVAGFLKPGGTFYMREGHPMMWAMEWRDDDEMLVVHYPYFRSEPVSEVWNETYAGEGRVEHGRTVEWTHSLGEIFCALIGAGLRITHFEEHREAEWQGLPSMTSMGDGRWQLPENLRDRLPLMYSLMAEMA